MCLLLYPGVRMNLDAVGVSGVVRRKVLDGIWLVPDDQFRHLLLQLWQYMPLEKHPGLAEVAGYTEHEVENDLVPRTLMQSPFVQ